jgi:hypothetical protein
MNKTVINVPKGIEYLSEWENFSLPNFPCIINKQITGCGFTQWALTCNTNIILCSPRRILLENKRDNYYKDLKEHDYNLPYKLYYAKNEYEKILEVDKDLTAQKKSIAVRDVDVDYSTEEAKNYLLKFKQGLQNFLFSCEVENKFCKILVTYDSFRRVKEFLESSGLFNRFHVVIDEFQSIFTDATFKSGTELEFVNSLQNYNNVCYVSATPMIEEYLDQMDEFKNLPYYEMDWGAEDPGRIIKPKIVSMPCARLLRKAYEIVDKYKNDDWKDSDNNVKSYIGSDGLIHEIKSKEAVFYMNSVKNICDIIKSKKLTQEECNVLCAKTSSNSEAIRKAFRVKKDEFQGIGKVPMKGDPNKMFTFCTRTVYLGADFYSDNARSFVFSDANSKTMTVDITLDLPQILGRQRMTENPWKDELEIYFSSLNDSKKESREDFIKKVNTKKKQTLELIASYEEARPELRNSIAFKYEQVDNYKYDYLSINKHAGSSPQPAFNNLVMLSEIREYEIRQIEYADRCAVRSFIKKQFNLEDQAIIDDVVRTFENYSTFINKMKYLCESLNNITDSKVKNEILMRIDSYFTNYYLTLGPDRIAAFSYRHNLLEQEYNKLKGNQVIDPRESIINSFKVGEKYSKLYIKTLLRKIYNDLEYKRTPKATDLEEYFEMRSVNYMENGKKTHGFEIISLKE